MKQKKDNYLKANPVLSICKILLLLLLPEAFLALYLKKVIKADNVVTYYFLIYYLILFIFFFVSILIAFGVFAAGFLLFGFIAGYKFVYLKFGSFVLIRIKGKFKVKRSITPGIIAQCIFEPPDLNGKKLPALLYNLGGGILCSSVAVTALCLYFYYGKNFSFSIILLIIAISFITVVLTNLIPMRIGMYVNNGMTAVSLCKSKEASRYFQIALKIIASMASGKFLTEMPDDWFGIPSDDEMKNNIIADTAVSVCDRLNEKLDFQKADLLAAHFLEIKSGMSVINLKILTCNRIYYELITQNRKDVITALLTDSQKNYMKIMNKTPSVIRTEYAYALLFENNCEKAEKIKSVFDKYAKSYLFEKEIATERTLMKKAEERFLLIENNVENCTDMN